MYLVTRSSPNFAEFLGCVEGESTKGWWGDGGEEGEGGEEGGGWEEEEGEEGVEGLSWFSCSAPHHQVGTPLGARAIGSPVYLAPLRLSKEVILPALRGFEGEGV